MNIIIISDQYQMPAPQVTVLGDHTLIIANEYSVTDAFALVTPVVQTDKPRQRFAPFHWMHMVMRRRKTGPSPVNIVLDQMESYRLYQCLHTLFQDNIVALVEDEETCMEQTRIHWLEREVIESGEPCN